MSKKSKKGLKGSSTAGRSKGQNCQRSELKTLYAKDPRLHRTNPKLYEACCVEVGKQKGNYPFKPQQEAGGGLSQ